MNKFYRTYLITARHHETQETFVYAGKRTSTHKDPRRDPYMGSGKRISEMVESGEYDFHVVWSNDYKCPEALHMAEIELIRSLSVFGDQLLNERGICVWGEKTVTVDHDISISVDAAIANLHKGIVEKGSNEYRKMCSDARKTAPWWYEPMKSTLFEAWTKLGKCSEATLRKAATQLWPHVEFKKSSLQSLVNEFKTEGYSIGKQKS